ncbi:MAG: hypothetical protein JKY10_11170 [Cohaesibacteraceae bacterium]|nr:hypothetical protein [Cohaesibacteraceae bacterium]
MRARMAITKSGITCDLREIVLRNKPEHMLTISPKATIPVIQLADGTSWMKVSTSCYGLFRRMILTAGSNPRAEMWRMHCYSLNNLMVLLKIIWICTNTVAGLKPKTPL